jgi:carbonic anhydrase
LSILNEILEHNRAFVARRDYVPFRTDRYPNKQIVVVTCMDTRLVELLPAAMNLRQGDAKVLKTAGAIVAHPFGSIMRSIMVAVYELDAREVLVVGHHDCGMTAISPERIIAKAQARGVDATTIEMLRNSGVDLEKFLSGFNDIHESVRASVAIIRNHPLLPRDITVQGLIMDPDTGELETAE